ncbi:MAG TPA: carboxypeptidase regulatory-like domain-containing protein [Bryobacteraceae bacterium]|nr:carboxypeptidase regulatory-like domain-containing protein [Bryobacteraceae bacterium]
MKFRHLAASCAGLLFLAFTSFAQITAVEGVVKGADGKPVQGAIIYFTRTDIKANYKVKSDKKGHYIYNGLPIGTYNLSCEIDGKEVDKVNNVKTRPGDPLQMDFDASKAVAAQAAQQAAMQQAAQNGQLSKEQERSMTPEQKKAFEEQMKKREAEMKKNAALNEAYNGGKAALEANPPNYQQAVDSFTKAEELADTDNNKLAVYSNLADAYMKLALTKTGADFDATMGKCIETYGKALALKPDDAGMHNNYGLALAKSKKYTEAQAELEKAAQLDPARAGQYYYNLGATETNVGQIDPATAAFKKAMEATPPYAEAFYQYGVALMSKATTTADGKVTPAPGTVEAFQKYLEVAPNGPNAATAADMIKTLGSSVETSYKNPDASKKKSTKK